MNKFIVLGTLLVGFIGYGLLPWVIAIFQLIVATEKSVEILSVMTRSIAVLIQLVGIWQILQKNMRGLHLFFLVIFLNLFFLIGHEISTYINSEASVFPIFSILNEAAFPLLAVWILYFSDVKNYFNVQTEVKS
jgi:hypothetical protein